MTTPTLSPRQQGLMHDVLNTGQGAWSGAAILAWDEQAARVGFSVREEMLTAWRTLNGGMINNLVEIPSFMALLPTIGEGELPVTNDIFIQHLRPLPGEARYEMVGRLLRRGRTMAWTDVVVTADGKEVSLARITKTILKQPA